MTYKALEIEKKWQRKWEENGTFVVENKSDKPSYYILDMFPYPSGSGLHVGHPLGYIASDITARYKRQQGYHVLHPIGFDSFGLPAEQYALSIGVHPAESIDKNIDRYRTQLKMLGLSYDWSRELRTSDPSYYRWTQKIFVLLFNHWYDTKADKARPIEELIKIFEKEGNLSYEKDKKEQFSAEQWNSSTESQKADILMNYRLAYRKVSFVNWCEALGTVLANDEVVNGVSERGGYPVVKKPMLQWALRITAYAERLLTGLKTLDWSDSLKIQQENWINKSSGVHLAFNLASANGEIEVFTTRPDTIYGVTFMVLAPEHDLVDSITTAEYSEAVQKYKKDAAALSDVERMQEKKVSGQFTGAYALHPLTGEEIPIYIADYVFADYGTGAIMAVPADDERDQRFAEKLNIPIKQIIDRSEFPDAEIGDHRGTLINSDIINGFSIPDAIEKMSNHLEELKIGYKEVTYKLRDANFSRQRYWGEPFPVIYNNKTGIAQTLPEEELPLELPNLQLNEIQDSHGKAPLSALPGWVNEREGYTREVDTMPGYAGSSWYYLRFMDANNNEEMFSSEAVNYWKNVNLYIGGTEHAVGHLMYSRFWHKFLYDLGYVPTDEPFERLVNQGMINGRSLFLKVNNPKTGVREIHIPIQLADEHDYISISALKALAQEDNRYQDIDFESEVDWTEIDGEKVVKLRPEIEKMSKSKYNVVNPEDIIEDYGADCFRMYEMFLGPIQDHKPWDTQGISGVAKFLNRLWSLFYDQNDNWIVSDDEPSKEELKILHQCIKKVHADIESMSFNTCVSAFMVAVNDLQKLEKRSKAVLEDLIKLIAPFAPHLSEELWELCGNTTSISTVPFPEYIEKYTVESSFVLPLCVNGKKRAEIEIPADATQDQMKELALQHDQITKWIEGKEIKRVIVVPKRMVNIVV